MSTSLQTWLLPLVLLAGGIGLLLAESSRFRPRVVGSAVLGAAVIAAWVARHSATPVHPGGITAVRFDRGDDAMPVEWVDLVRTADRIERAEIARSIPARPHVALAMGATRIDNPRVEQLLDRLSAP